jgi:hypothetical protein
MMRRASDCGDATTKIPSSIEPAEGTMPNAEPHNAYPELPVIGYQKTSIPVGDAVAYIGSKAIDKNAKRASFVMFNNESGHGVNGINNNYAGFQADGDRRDSKWTPLFSGTCVKVDGTGERRRFLCFKDWHGCFDLLCDSVVTRGIYVGGYAHPYANMQINTIDEWPLGYWREWVTGSDTTEIKPSDKADLLAQYQKAITKFP